MRRPRHISSCTGSTTSLQQNHNGGGGSSGSVGGNITGTHQRLSRFLSYRQSGSFRIHKRGGENVTGSRKIINESGESSRSKTRSPSPTASR